MYHISNSQDIIDSRNIISRIEELQDEQQALKDAVADVEANLSESDENTSDLLEELEEANLSLAEWNADAGAELKILEALRKEAEDISDDWEYGCTLVKDSYFEQYAQELAEDISDSNLDRWPCTCINWKMAYRDLKQNYTSVDFDGVTYWVGIGS